MKPKIQETIPSEKGMLFKIVTNLTFWVLIAIVCGILLGHFIRKAGWK